MKLWLLRPNRPKHQWEPWYDKAFGFVVRAEDECAARIIAAENKGDEGQEAWLNPRYSSCVELLTEGNPEVIIRDFASA